MTEIPPLPKLPNPESIMRSALGEDLWWIITMEERKATKPYLAICDEFCQFASPDGAAVMGND